MPEGDTIARAARTLHRVLAGAVVTRFETRYAHLARWHDEAPLTGRTVDEVRAAGKHVLMRFSARPGAEGAAGAAPALVLRTHMRMRGSWHVYRTGEPWQRAASGMRVLVGTADWVAVGFQVPDAEFVRAADVSRHRPLARLGPDALAPEFDAAAGAARLLDAGARPVADVLLDQRILAGLGNVYKSEVLFLARVHPARRANRLEAGEAAAIIDHAVRLLRVNAARAAGNPRRAGRRTTGRLDPDARLWVYARANQPCRRCGEPIRAAATGPDARRTYWCPRCQRLEA